MSKKSPKRIQKNLDEMLIATVGLLEDLHIVHKKTAFEDLLSTKMPGMDITLAKLIRNLFNILMPMLDLVRMKYPALFMVLDWAQAIVEKLLKR